MAIVVAASLGLLLVAAGTSVDYAIAHYEKTNLQEIADAAVLAGAKRLSLVDHQRSDAESLVNTVVANYMAQNAGRSAGSKYTATTTITTDPVIVSLTLRQSIPTPFAAILGRPAVALEISAVAEVVGQPNLCLLALDGSVAEALKIDRGATTTANNCAAFSNSTSGSGLYVKDKASLMASAVCSAGGVQSDGSISPNPLTDCPQFLDPLASQQEPAIGPCDHTNLAILNQDRTLSPGVYCGGLKIQGDSNITLEPGVFIFTTSGELSPRDGTLIGGKLEVKGKASITGVDVSIYLDETTTMKFDKKSTIDLEASRDGIMPGILIFASRGQSDNTKHKIESSNAQKMLGTLYFPTSTIEIGSFYEGGANVGGSAAYTAIVANKIKVKNKSSLILNTDFALTDVPVPKGIRGVAQPVRLSK